MRTRAGKSRDFCAAGRIGPAEKCAADSLGRGAGPGIGDVGRECELPRDAVRRYEIERADPHELAVARRSRIASSRRAAAERIEQHAQTGGKREYGYYPAEYHCGGTHHERASRAGVRLGNRRVDNVLHDPILSALHPIALRTAASTAATAGANGPG